MRKRANTTKRNMKHGRKGPSYIGPTKLLPKGFARKIPLIDLMRDPNEMIVHAHYFTCFTSWDWWVVEGRPVPSCDDYLFRGFFKGPDGFAFGDWSLSDLESLGGPFGMGKVERETLFPPTPLIPLMRRMVKEMPHVPVTDVVQQILDTEQQVQKQRRTARGGRKCQAKACDAHPGRRPHRN